MGGIEVGREGKGEGGAGVGWEARGYKGRCVLHM